MLCDCWPLSTRDATAKCCLSSASLECPSQSSFLPRDAMLARYWLSSCVCPSVSLFVTSRSCTKMAKPRITLTTPYNNPGTLAFRYRKSWRNSNDITPNGGAKYRWGRFESALFDQYLAISQKRCKICLLYTSPSPRDRTRSRMPSSA